MTSPKFSTKPNSQGALQRIETVAQIDWFRRFEQWQGTKQ